ncbi:MAG TPA: ATP-dependent Clp protease adaptor ClpS [Fimbriimonadaceae bacterium]|nr:ATP-dependent Clp protease adaptor ClpS [Fimbriimonadaceae bacterium]
MERLTVPFTATTVAPEIADSDTSTGGGWIVTVFDNDYNTIEEVIQILMFATKCDLEEAQIETWEIHHLGRSVVHHGAAEECRTIATTIATIGIRVEISQE